MEKTRAGAMIRAAVDDSQWPAGGYRYLPGFHVHLRAGRVSRGLGGRDRRGFLGIYPGLDFEILPVAFAVVIIGVWEA